MPSILLSLSQRIVLILTVSRDSYYFIPYFTDEATEGQKSKTRGLRSQSGLAQTQAQIAFPLAPQPHLFTKTQSAAALPLPRPPRPAPHTLRVGAL